MQLGIHTGTFQRPTITGALEATLRCGLQYVHLNLKGNGSDTIEPQAAAAAARMLVETGMRVASLSGTFNMAHPDASVRNRGLAQLAELAPLAEHFQAPIISLCTGTRNPDSMWRGHPDNQTPEAWRDFTRTLETALHVAECYQVILGIEPEPANIIDNARTARRLLDEYPSDYLKIIFDPANLVDASSLDNRLAAIDEGFDLLGPDIALAHAKELAADGTAGGLPPGTGILDWRHVFRRLRHTGFDGCVILHGLSESDVPMAVRFLDAHMDGA
ncbi:MAG: sugar phosphate isomerase/epimerase family protein [Patescibacteria group bacterium]|nr:sugar phosphate isomerase/epimerase family protein [Patescibacteria group bacterium]